MIRKVIGVMRYLKKPFGKNKRYRVYKFDRNVYKPDFNIYVETGKWVYPPEFYEKYDLNADEPFSNATKEKHTKTKYHEEEKWLVPDKFQPVYMITEEIDDLGYVFVEAKFYKNVTYKEWENTPLYTKQVNWIH
jgi:hypothetical protein